MLSIPESAPGRIVKQPPSFAARTGPSSLPLQHQQQVQAGPSPAGGSNNSNPVSVPGPSSGLTPASGGVMGIMDTIPEDTSLDSHLGAEGTAEADDFTTAGACSSDTRSSFEDLTEPSQQGRGRRLKRQECIIDSKETEC